MPNYYETTFDAAALECIIAFFTEDRTAFREAEAKFVELIDAGESDATIGQEAWKFMEGEWEKVMESNGDIPADSWTLSEVFTSLFRLRLSEESATALGERLVKAYGK